MKKIPNNHKEHLHRILKQEKSSYMNRDGANKSLWQVTHGNKSVNALPTGRIFDVVIIGAGITGISTAIKLQEAGKDCIVLEAANIAFGTTGGTTAHLNTLFECPYYEIIDNFGKDNALLV